MDAEPPAGLRFCNLQPLSLGFGNGYEVEGNANEGVYYVVLKREHCMTLAFGQLKIWNLLLRFVKHKFSVFRVTCGLAFRSICILDWEEFCLIGIDHVV
jgi:hypothetical protein